MLRFPASILKPFLSTQSNFFPFAKMIKMVPVKKEKSTYPMRKSIKLAAQIFAKYGITDTEKPQKLNAYESAEGFIDLVADIDSDLFEKNIFTKVTTEEVNQIYRKLDKDHIITNVIELMIAQKEFTVKTRRFLTNFFTCQLLLAKRKMQQLKSTPEDICFIGKMMDLLNQYLVLLQLNDKLVINYLFFINILIRNNIIDEKRSHFLNQKIMIDYLIQSGPKALFKQRDLMQIFQYFSTAGVTFNYSAKYYPFLTLIISKIPSYWYRDPTFDKKKLILMYGRSCFDSKKINNGLRYFMDQPITWASYQIVAISLSCYIKVKAYMFDSKSIPEEYIQTLKRISKFIREQKKPSQKGIINIQSQNQPTKKDWEYYIYRNLIPNLYRSSIWQEDIWFDFAQWLESDQNYKKIGSIHLVTIFELIEIDKDIIPESIRQRMLKSKNFLLTKHNLRIENIDLIKEYFQQFGDRIKGFYTSQQQITNALRSVCRRNVKSQVLINFDQAQVRIFLVDILIDDTIIIEINNQLHYIQNDRGADRISNLKSVFRKRVLQKLGYKLLEYEVELIVEGNLDFLKNVQNELEKIGKQMV